MDPAFNTLCLFLAPYRRLNGRTPPMVFAQALLASGFCDGIEPADFGMEDLAQHWETYKDALNSTIIRALDDGETKPGSVAALAKGCGCDLHAIADASNRWPIWAGCLLHGTWRIKH